MHSEPIDVNLNIAKAPKSVCSLSKKKLGGGAQTLCSYHVS